MGIFDETLKQLELDLLDLDSWVTDESIILPQGIKLKCECGRGQDWPIHADYCPLYTKKD
jgi:hypothetical protein